MIGGAAIALLGSFAIPFTAGASTGIIAMGLTAGSVTVTTAELAMICGTVIAMAGVIKGGRVKFKVNAKDGSVEVEFEPKYTD